MAATLTAESFARLLECLDADGERAGEKYEELRHRLIKFFEWRGAPFPEDHTDDCFNRVARKLADQIEIHNLNAYCYEVARLVCLEARKGYDSRRESWDPNQHSPRGASTADEATERELLLGCLDDCLDRLPAESRAVIIEYYQDQRRDKIERRRALAAALGLRREALANRAQRLRDKLERCVTRCVTRKTAI